ncbi:MAG: hypothetical protein O2782_17470 [bacterium]|nr:hypothetical protein [bacterium]
MSITVHVTHEAIHKVGGIGSVLAGLITAGPYRQATQRTILVGPLTDRHRAGPLGMDGTVLYDNWSGIRSDSVGPALYDIERARGVRLVYGRRRFDCPDGTQVEPEVLLVDVEGSVPHGLGYFKFLLFQAFGLASDRHDGQWEYEQYVRLAEPAYDAVMSLLQDRGDTPVHFVAHEFMGLPTAFKAQLAGDSGVSTIFYAHEVATARRLVEELQGGDVAFYGALHAAVETGQYVDDIFGPQDAFYKHALIRQAWRCDAIFAVGDLVVKELQFLGAEFSGRTIDRVYNGLPVTQMLTPTEREAARGRLASVAEGLLGWSPDFVFTHVGRLVPSKGLWRDLLVLDGLEEALAAQGRSAVLILLATEAGPRLPASIEQIRRDYAWPVVHREGYPDLTSGELEFDLRVRLHNARARRTRALFVNQFGFDTISTGGAVPPGVDFADLRRGSDAEFGMSTYEPFGIAQIEPLAFGALSVISDACGCLGYLQQVAAKKSGPPLFVLGDFTRGGGDAVPGEGGWPGLDAITRRQQEQRCSRQVARSLGEALQDDAAGRERQLRAGHSAAAAMSWDQVVKAQYLPAIARLEQRL